MSKIGKNPIEIPEGVEVELKDRVIKVKGPKGELEMELRKEIEVEIKDKEIKVSSTDNALWGLFRSLIFNMIEGVTNGFEKKLQIVGVGWKAEVKDKKLVLNVGYSHPVEMEIPEGIDIKAEKDIITVSGIDKQLVGQVAAEIRSRRKPEPYKGKGIRYIDEVVKLKAGKKAVGVEG
jgi:large subunit ribosomal protein L6